VSLWWWWHHSWLLHHGLGWHHIWVHHRLAHWHLLPHHRLWRHHLLLLHHHRVHHGLLHHRLHRLLHHLLSHRLLHHWLSHRLLHHHLLLHHHRILVHRLGHLLVHNCGCRHCLLSLRFLSIWGIWIRLGLVNISSLNLCYLNCNSFIITFLTLRLSALSYHTKTNSVKYAAKDTSHDNINNRITTWRCAVIISSYRVPLRRRNGARRTCRVLVWAEKIWSGTSFPFTSWWTVVYAAYFCRSWRGAIWRSTTGLVRR